MKAHRLDCRSVSYMLFLLCRRSMTAGNLAAIVLCISTVPCMGYGFAPGGYGLSAGKTTARISSATPMKMQLFPLEVLGIKWPSVGGDRAGSYHKAREEFHTERMKYHEERAMHHRCFCVNVVCVRVCVIERDTECVLVSCMPACIFYFLF